MAEEVKQQQEQQPQPNVPQGWKDIFVHPDMSLSLILNFINGLNQRLAHIEDVILVDDPENKDNKVTFTELYKREAEAQAKKQPQPQQPKGE